MKLIFTAAVAMARRGMYMTEVELWGVLTIATGLGNCRVTNRKAD
jgi:hypothetical protein